MGVRMMSVNTAAMRVSIILVPFCAMLLHAKMRG